MKKISTLRMVLGIILSIIILAFAQSLSLGVSGIILQLGVPEGLCNISAGILYIIFTLGGVKILCEKFLKITMYEIRASKFQVKGFWIVIAIMMPVLVLLISILIGGKWEINKFDQETTIAIVTSAIVFYGLATGIVEEIIFRGVIMKCLERHFNIQIAVLVPSVLFGALHVMGNHLDFISTIQLLAAGSIVGILFSLIAYKSNSIWNNAIVHSVWNTIIIGGILHIGDSADSSSIFNFILENKMFLFSGGDFGIEASIISIFVYLIFCVIVLFSMKKR